MYENNIAGRYLLLSYLIEDPRPPSYCMERTFFNLDDAKELALNRASSCQFGWCFEVYDLQDLKTIWEYCRPRNEREVKEEAERRANGPQFVLTGTTLIKASNVLHFGDAPAAREPAAALMGATGEEDFGRRRITWRDMSDLTLPIVLLAVALIAAYQLR